MAEINIDRLWPEKPKPKNEEKTKEEIHRFEWAVGYCPTCKDIRARNTEAVINNILRVRQWYEEQLRDAKYKCKTCGVPIPAKSDEELRSIESCPFCGGKSVVRKQ
ncbi:MAG: hypothetical protein QXF78_05270 [Pyrobaculum sp.]